jgi:hypothetical protein
MRRGAPAWLLLLAWACAQPAGPPPGTATPLPPPVLNVPPDFEAVCELTGGAYCDWRIRCGLEQPQDRTRCIDSLDCRQERMRTAAALGEIGVDAGVAVTCASQYSTQPCELAVMGELYDYTYECQEMIVGRQDAGQPCHVRQACGGGNFCLVSAVCPPTCEALGGPGAPCSPQAPCGSVPLIDGGNLYLSCLHDGGGFPTCEVAPLYTCHSAADCEPYQVCRPQGDAGYCALNYVVVPEGATCDVSFPSVPDGGPLRFCAFTDGCVDDPSTGIPTCLPYPTLGESCLLFQDCLGPFACVPMMDGGEVCAPPGGNGAPCIADGLSCLDFFTCVNGACAPVLDAGAPCEADASACQYYATCDPASSTCFSAGEGSLCAQDSDCGSGFCDFYGQLGGTTCLPSCF